MTTALTEIAEQELFIVTELREKELARLDLVALKAKTALDIEIVDKITYKIVHDAQIELRDNRTRISKGRLLFTESLTKQTKEAIQCEKDLIARIEPTEQALKAKKEAYDTEQERIKKEKEEAELLVLQDRLQELNKYGVVMDIGTVKIMTEDGFRMMADQWKKKYEEREAIRIQEEEAQEKKRQEEAEEIRKQKEENDRVAAENKRIADENARKAQEIQDKENEIKRQEELVNKAEEARIKDLADAKAEYESNRVTKETIENFNKERLIKNKSFEAWLIDNGVTSENRDEFDIRVADSGYVLWRRVSTFK